jgi:hypothetical protein
MFKRMTVGCVAVLAAVAAAPAAAGSADFVQVQSRAFAESPAKARALLKNLPQQPAPKVNVLSASIASDGSIVTRCESQTNPAYGAWLEELRDTARQER